MKKYILVLSLTFIFFGCSGEEDRIEDEEVKNSVRNFVNKNESSSKINSPNVEYITIKDNKKPEVEFIGCYIKKEDGIYNSEDIKIENVDVETFKVLSTSCYAKDANKVYFSSEILENADFETFEIIEKDYIFAKDKNNFYYAGEDINVDYDSFEILGGSFYKDKNFVYYGGNGFEKIKGLNASSTIFLNDGYIKDDNYVFCNSFGMVETLNKINNADVKTFSVYGNDLNNFIYARDKNNCYYDCEVVNISECEKVENQK